MKKLILILLVAASFFNLQAQPIISSYNFSEEDGCALGIDSLEAGYLFEGDADDCSGNGNNGTLSGVIGDSLDRFNETNSCYYFDGTDDYITTNTSFPLADAVYSFSFFIKRVNGTDEVNLINQRGNGGLGFRIYINATTINLGLWGVNVYSRPASLNNTNWNHVVVIFDDVNHTFTAYLNGASRGTSSSVGDYRASTTNAGFLVDMSSYGAINGYYEGILDDVRIFNKGLSTEEVLTLYGERDYAP